jgi:hypothetical protein
MKKYNNTKNGGVFHYKIFKWNNSYIGICWETGDIQETDSFDETKRKLFNGTCAILKTVIKSEENLLGSINTKPPFKYQIMYKIALPLSVIESFKNKKEDKGYFSFSQPIPSFCNK